MKRWDLKLSVFYGLTDLLILNLLLFIITSYFSISSYYISRLPVFSFIWLVLALANNLYNFHRHSNFRFRLLNYLKCHFAFSGILSLLYLSFGFQAQLKSLFIPLIVAYPVINILGVSVLMYSIGYLRTKGRNAKKVLIVGTGNTSVQLLNYIESNPDFGYRIIGILSDSPGPSFSKYKIVGSLESIDKVLQRFKLNEIIITLPTTELDKIKHIMNHADFFGVRVRLIPDYQQLLGSSFTLATFGDLPVINVRAISLDRIYLATLKRIFDIAFSVATMIFLAPLMICLVLAIFIDSKGPLFYCPIRIGKGGREFKLFKFRSMYAEYSQANVSYSTKKNDPRLTRVGTFIRKYSLDELPQFLNVLLGDMSVVGPRPHRMMLNQVMQQEVDKYMLRHYLKPGITGWAQVNGWRGPTETEEERVQRTSHDLWYVNNWSLALDMKIVYLTVFDPKTHKRAF